ncbi:MAG: acetyl-CoA decarbonylase/synthase complex subunit gamma [Candidatus Bathyarchaeia archaeon]
MSEKKLSPMDIYRLLPKTNCGKCGSPTCMAFAFKLAQGAVTVDKCPFLTDEAKRALMGLTAPPVAVVSIGHGGREVKLGGERVSFRHEDKFYNEPAIAVELNDLIDVDALETALKTLKEYEVERMGQTLKINMLALRNLSSEDDAFIRLVEAVKAVGYPLIISTENPTLANRTLDILKGERPLLHGASLRNITIMAMLAKRFNCPISIKASDWRELISCIDRLKGLGFSEIVLQPPGDTLKQLVENLTIIRRLAIDKKFSKLGYPTIVFSSDVKSNVPEHLTVSALLVRYASIIVVKPEVLPLIRPVMLLRQSIMMDPRAPISIKSGLYRIGKPSENSPVLLTTNYALTFHILRNDLENQNVDCHLLVVDTGGLSVACSVAGNKLKPDSVRQMIEETDLEAKVAHRTLVIPGRAAKLAGEIEDITGWRVLIGPFNSKDIGDFLRKHNLIGR